MTDYLDAFDDDDALLGDVIADDSAEALCPYCGELVEIVLDPTGGADQRYVEDCPVCCRPWWVRVAYVGGEATVELETEDT
jgi:Cysteine-rich CPXCG